MFFSVIIPVYNDWPRLKTCLISLQCNKTENFDFEVIVVNNEEEHNPPKFISSLKGIKLIHEPEPGSYTARNRGAKLARGECFAFTDSDCIPDHQWLMKAKRCFEEQKCDLIGGRIDLFKEEQGSEWAYIYEKYTAFSQSKNMMNGHIVTANLIVKKDVFDSLDGFDHSLKSGGDWNFSKRAMDAGFKLQYADDVVVKHPARKSIKAIIKKQKRFAAWGFVKAKKKFRYSGLRILASNLISGIGQIRKSAMIPDKMNEKVIVFIIATCIYFKKSLYQTLFAFKFVNPEKVRE